MRPSRHLALSGAAGGVVWGVSGEPWALAVTVGSGVLVDIDHAPDYWWAFALRREPVCIVFLHGWEWLLGLMVASIWIGFPWWLVAVVTGYGLHLVTDHTFNGERSLGYSLIFRALHRFQKRQVDPDWDYDRVYEVMRKELPFALMLAEWWNGRSVARNQSPRSGPS